MSDKTLVLITGANQGLGYYATQQLSATDKYHILLGSRDLKKAEAAIATLTDDASAGAKPENVSPIQIDVTSDSSIAAAAEKVKSEYGYLDVIMLNAGVASAEGTLREQYHKMFDTNLFGAAATLDAFLPLLKKSTAPGGKRIAFTSSGLSSLKWAWEKEDDYSAEMYPIYRSTKTAMSMIMLHYAKLLEKDGFVVGASE
jgi:NAD(P)-dependent dehydrogenase (short-subunit alcohol dehydrogenase family)